MLGRVVRHCLTGMALVGLLLLGGCGGSDDPKAPVSPGSDSTSASVDPEAEILDRWDSYWKARVESENTAKINRAEFSQVARDGALEWQSGLVQRYRKGDLVRVGQPRFRDAEVRVTERSATVLACLNGDDWTAIIEGKPWAAKKYGWEQTGSVMTQLEDGQWYVTTRMTKDEVIDMGKKC